MGGGYGAVPLSLRRRPVRSVWRSALRPAGGGPRAGSRPGAGRQGDRGGDRVKKALFLILLVVSATLVAVRPGRALPEYATQTGEPCATCHLSASGGGLRTPRGQAWVGSDKPGAVPALADALALLGVHLKTDEAAFLKAPGAVKPAAPLAPPAGLGSSFWATLENYP